MLNESCNLRCEGCQVAALARECGFAREETLTERGARWIHWRQNICVLDYIDRVWTHSKATPFPEGIRL